MTNWREKQKNLLHDKFFADRAKNSADDQFFTEKAKFWSDHENLAEKAKSQKTTWTGPKTFFLMLEIAARSHIPFEMDMPSNLCSLKSKILLKNIIKWG